MAVSIQFYAKIRRQNEAKLTEELEAKLEEDNLVAQGGSNK
jgi:hypothetical protein